MAGVYGAMSWCILTVFDEIYQAGRCADADTDTVLVEELDLLVHFHVLGKLWQCQFPQRSDLAQKDRMRKSLPVYRQCFPCGRIFGQPCFWSMAGSKGGFAIRNNGTW